MEDYNYTKLKELEIWKEKMRKRIKDKNNVLKKVQVKATSCKTKYNKYQVALKSCGGTKGETYKTIIDTKIDEVFIVTDTMEMFIIPIEEIKNKTTLNLCEKYEKK